MKPSKTIRFCMATAMLALASSAVASHGYGGRPVKESIEISDHFIFNTPNKVIGSTVLIRDFRNRKITATVSSSVLEPHWAYSMWWAVFNNPKYCATPNDCKVSDLEVFGGDPRIRASVFYAGGFVADGSGAANSSLELLPGRTKRELFAESKNYGLRNLRKAEIHLVVRSHGVAGMWGSVAQQVGTANMACPPTDCKNVFASFHPPRD